MSEFDVVARQVREVHGLELLDGRVAPEGESGGAWFTQLEGVPVVAKWVEPAAAPRFVWMAAVLDEARGRGVPVPRYRAPLVTDDYCVLIQEVMSGGLGSPSPQLVVDIGDCVERMTGISAPHHLRGTWGATVVRSLTDGLEGWCVHEALAEAGGAGAEIVRHARAVGVRTSESMFPANDLMHMDLHTKNVLQDSSGRLAGIVDWESACAGDWRFDLAYFAFSADTALPGVASEAWSKVEAATPPQVFEAYVAHMVLRMADWSLRHSGPSQAERWIDAGRSLIARYS